jgi:ABC-type Zn uptake system ZnuABC Zn-binding protein ZnuA
VNRLHPLVGRAQRLAALFLLAWVAACAPEMPAGERAGLPTVLATETFLADITGRIAGDRLQVQSLVPVGLDPHAFEPTPRDVVKIAESNVLVANGAGFESWLEPVLSNAGGQRITIEASSGLASRKPTDAHDGTEAGDAHGDVDPHFWLDPINVIRYTENIRDGLIRADPAGAALYRGNADAYIAELEALDAWIREEVAQVPADRRLLVTNHESFGYFADRYGFTVVGAVLPSFSTGASPSAQQMARLADDIAANGAPAIFLETGASADLARQIASDTGIKVVTDLYTHSLTAPGGPASSYLEMMRHNTRAIVEALK